MFCKKFQKLGLLNLHLYKLKDGQWL
jgi:hypothetical protein